MRFQNTSVKRKTIRFGPQGSAGEKGTFELDVQNLELLRRGRPVDLRPQAAHALAVLLERPGRLVTFDEFRLALWGDQHLEWRNSLHQCVRDLRRALEDDARDPRFVATVARLGYRFTGERASVDTAGSGSSSSRQHHGSDGGSRRPWLVFAAGFATALLLPALLVALCAVFPG